MSAETSKDTGLEQSAQTLAMWAVAVFFFANGAGYGSWVSRLPEIRRQLGVGDTGLGLALLGGGIGAFVVGMYAGRLVDRRGGRRTIGWSALCTISLLPLLSITTSPAAFFVALFVIGGCDAITDTAGNEQGMVLQRRTHRSIIVRFHAAWSIGTLAGGLAGSQAARLKIDFTTQLLVTTAVLAAAVIWAHRHLPGRDEQHDRLVEERAGPVARRVVVLLVVLGAFAIMSELPATEWATLMMAERFDLPDSTAAFGFIGFAVGMVIGRLAGDRLLDHLGDETGLVAASTASLVGLVVACTSPTPWLTVIAFTVAAAGCSLMNPLLVRRSSRTVPGARGIALLGTGGRFGILVGPPFMGIVSDMTSRSTALLLIGGGSAAGMLVLALRGRR